MSGTDLVALLGGIAGVVGGITGVIALTLEVSREWRERAQLHVSAIVGDYYSGGNLRQVAGHIVVGTLVNAGRRPIYVTNIVFQGADNCDREMIASGLTNAIVYDQPSFPCRLEEGASVSFRWPVETLQRDGLNGLSAYDSLGKVWRAPEAVVEKLRTDVSGKKSPPHP